MGNLGWYQKMTTWSKKVGGPKNLFGIVLGTGALIGVSGMTIADNLLNKKDSNLLEIDREFKVTTAGQDSTNLSFEVEDIFRVILIDEEAVLIEKIKDENNPYYVSNDFLKQISLSYSEYIKNNNHRSR